MAVGHGFVARGEGHAGGEVCGPAPAGSAADVPERNHCQCREDPDNGYDDQQLEQGKPRLAFASVDGAADLHFLQRWGEGRLVPPHRAISKPSQGRASPGTGMPCEK